VEDREMRLTTNVLRKLVLEALLKENEEPKFNFEQDVKIPAHHVTLHMGSWKGDPSYLGKMFTVEVENIAFSTEKQMIAVGVSVPTELSSFVKSGNPHITIAFDPKKSSAKDAGSLDYTKGIPVNMGPIQCMFAHPKAVEGRPEVPVTKGYTGLVLTKAASGALIGLVNQTLGTSLEESNTDESWAPSSENKTEGLLRVRSLVREELRRMFRNR
jgi:hypothetical protein